MTRPGIADDDAGGAIRPSTRLQAVLLWSGPIACAGGMVAMRMGAQWEPGRFLELLVVAAAHVALAWPLARASRMRMASALLAPIVVALAVFAGVLPVLATGLLLVAAIAIGGAWAPDAPVGLRGAAGLALVAGVLGWLLPLPVHFDWLYAAACVAIVVLGRRALLDAGRRSSRGWSEAVASAPRAAAFAVLAMALAATGCWLPTLQFDDLGYHLSLPWQLVDAGRYALDPTHQAWALAPWASDVLHGVPQVLAGAEARGPLNAAWLAITAAGVWRLARALGGSIRLAWLSVAAYASLPMTAGLAAGMQTETATTALLVWLAWLVANGRGRERSNGALLTGAVLAGGLVGLKLVAAAQALVLVAWAAVSRRPWARPAMLARASLLALVVGGSSYAYAAVVAGNPLLPLFNGWFRSPYFAPSDLFDQRWLAGFGPLLPWSLTFDTRAYSEQFTGSAGFGLVALAGAWLLALAWTRTRAMAIVATALFVLPLVPMQYLRYAFPAMVLLAAPLLVAAERVEPRRSAWLVLALVAANFAFQANANWMQRGGALKETIISAGADTPLFAAYAPERLLIAAIRESRDPRAVMVMDSGQPRQAEMGTRGRTTAWYAPRLHADAARADRDASGAAWVDLWRREQVGHVVIAAAPTPARAAALLRVRAIRRGDSGDVAWWQLPPEPAP